MTSTSFNVGLGDGSRLSSRVLRPPGGGHTDIFGGEPEPPRGRRQVPAASGAMFGHGDEPVKTPNAAETPTQNGSNEVAEAAQPEPAQQPQEPKPESPRGSKPKAESPRGPEPKVESPKSEAPKTEAPKRVRVPPGGFSSGLW